MSDLTLGVDYTRVLFGESARQAPAWLYVQDQGDGLVSFVGASHVPETAHPLRYGSERSHQFVVGEIILRPVMVLGTDTRRGDGFAGLATNHHDLDHMLTNGEYIIKPGGT